MNENRRSTDAITPKTPVSLGFVFSVLASVVAFLGFIYSAADARMSAQDQRLSVVENAVYNMSGDVHQIKGEMDILVNRKRER